MNYLQCAPYLMQVLNLSQLLNLLSVLIALHLPRSELIASAYTCCTNSLLILIVLDL
jgi:hypothetical protein